MGVYHQGGVVPGQIWIGQQNFSTQSEGGFRKVFWWRTYPPPIYLLGKSGDVNTTDLMGIPFAKVQQVIQYSLGDCSVDGRRAVGLVAPRSSVELDEWRGRSAESGVQFDELWHWNRHLNLDDMDFGEDGVWQTLKRVVGRRGLVIWSVTRVCEGAAGRVLGGDW